MTQTRVINGGDVGIRALAISDILEPSEIRIPV